LDGWKYTTQKPGSCEQRAFLSGLKILHRSGHRRQHAVLVGFGMSGRETVVRRHGEIYAAAIAAGNKGLFQGAIL